MSLSIPSPRTSLLTALAAALLAPTLPGCKGCSKDKGTETGTIGETGTEEEPYVPADWGQWLTMAATPEGNAAVAYYDRDKGALGYAEATPGDAPTWVHEQVDGYTSSEGLDTGDRGKFASMAIADDGTRWIAYQDLLTRTLRYATRTADGDWSSGVADTGEGATPKAGAFASLALDGSGYPVVAHYDEAKARLRVAHWNGSSFSGEVVDEGEDVTGDTGGTVDADVGQFARLRISGGTEYIAYYDAAAGALKLAVGTSGSYDIEVVDDGGDVGQWPDMLVASDGTIHIAYHDVENQDLKYAVGTPGSWTTTTVDEGEYVGADTALFLNGNYPAIVYFDGRNNDVKLAQNTGSDWTTDTLAGADGALGYHNEVITAAGAHYAACYDYTSRTIWFSPLD